MLEGREGEQGARWGTANITFYQFYSPHQIQISHSAAHMQRNGGERRLVRSSNTNMSDKYQPQSITTRPCLCCSISTLFPHLSPPLIDDARGRGVTRRPGAASRHGGSEATISSHRHQSPAATTSTSSEQVSPSHCQHSIASIAYSTLALASY